MSSQSNMALLAPESCLPPSTSILWSQRQEAAHWGRGGGLVSEDLWMTSSGSLINYKMPCRFTREFNLGFTVILRRRCPGSELPKVLTEQGLDQDPSSCVRHLYFSFPWTAFPGPRELSRHATWRGGRWEFNAPWGSAQLTGVGQRHFIPAPGFQR